MGSEWVPGKSLERNASSKWQELRTGQKHSYASFEVSLQLMSSTLISWHVSLSHQHNHYGSISCPILLAPLNITFTIPLWDVAIVNITLKDLSQKIPASKLTDLAKYCWLGDATYQGGEKGDHGLRHPYLKYWAAIVKKLWSRIFLVADVTSARPVYHLLLLRVMSPELYT